MSLFPPTDEDRAGIRDIGDLFVSGAVLLDQMLSDNTTSFEEWATKLRKDANVEECFATRSRLMWLWNALRLEPELKKRFGTLPHMAPWSGVNERFKVFEAGEWFVIGVKGKSIADLLKHPYKLPLEETVAVRTIDELLMKPKGKRLECCDCHAEVTIRVSEVFPVPREADVMEVAEDRIATGANFVKVRVESLNQAYTISSRRLEPTRRSHGGRTYDHVVHAGNGKRTLLEDIRQLVENGDWEVPPAHPSSEKK